MLYRARFKFTLPRLLNFLLLDRKNRCSLLKSINCRVFLEMNYGWASLRLILYLGLMLVCSACDEIKYGSVNDPFEGFNRRSHDFNLALDRNILRPVALNYAVYVPATIQTLISNAVENLSTPGDVANNLLQTDLENGVKGTVKFVINSSLGLGGIMRPAEAFGIQDEKTDFGETLHVWGVKEGPYLVLPFLGPSTGRDTFGTLADFSMDPIGRLLTVEGRTYSYGLKAADVLGARARLSKMFDSVLYKSIDSYEQTKLIYLQARRFELKGSQEDNYFDPYSEMFEE